MYSKDDAAEKIPNFVKTLHIFLRKNSIHIKVIDLFQVNHKSSYTI